MDEAQLRNFLMIAECGSITSASERLGLAQPSLSQQLLRLEDEIGATLFRRTSRGVEVTEAGRVFEEHARHILKASRLARQEARDSDTISRRKVSIGIPLSIGQLLTRPLLRAARSAFPEIALEIREALNRDVKSWVEDGGADLAILFHAVGARHLAVKPIAEETMLLIGPPGAFGPADAYGVAIEPVDVDLLGSVDLILLPFADRVREALAKMNGAGARKLSVIVETTSLEHIKAMVEDGFGYSILAHVAASQELLAGGLAAARIQDFDLRRNVSVVRSPSYGVSRASVAIEDIAMRLLREMMADGRWVVEEILDSTGDQ